MTSKLTIRNANNPADVRALFAVMTMGVLVGASCGSFNWADWLPMVSHLLKTGVVLLHAVAYDALWSLPFSFPSCSTWFAPGKPSTQGVGPWVKWGLLFQALLCSFSGLDHEMMRFRRPWGDQSISNIHRS